MPGHLDSAQGGQLLEIARASIEGALGRGGFATQDLTWLQEHRATFVTLYLRGALRGCIGSVEAHRPLVDDVRSNAVAAALRDRRFPELTPAELPQVEIEVSVLSPPSAIEIESEEGLLAQLRPGVDGLLLEFEGHRGTFLPAVWKSLPEPRTFVDQLKRKAGLATDFWDPEVRVWRYTVQSWSDGAAAR